MKFIRACSDIFSCHVCTYMILYCIHDIYRHGHGGNLSMINAFIVYNNMRYTHSYFYSSSLHKNHCTTAQFRLCGQWSVYWQKPCQCQAAHFSTKHLRERQPHKHSNITYLDLNIYTIQDASRYYSIQHTSI